MPVQYVILRDPVDTKACMVLRVLDKEAVIVARILQAPNAPDINPVEVALLTVMHYSDPPMPEADPKAGAAAAGPPAPGGAVVPMTPTAPEGDRPAAGGGAFRFAGG